MTGSVALDEQRTCANQHGDRRASPESLDGLTRAMVITMEAFGEDGAGLHHLHER